MTERDYAIYQGNSWNPGAVITENGTAKNCTDFSCKLIIKESNSRSSAIILEKAIDWTVQSEGTGTFTLTDSQTLGLKIQSYYYEAILYKTGYEKAIKKGKLIIEPALGLT